MCWADASLKCVNITIESDARSVIAGSDPNCNQMDIHLRPSENSGLLCTRVHYKLLLCTIK